MLWHAFFVSNIFMNSLDAIIEKISREKKIVTNIDNLLVFYTSRKTPLYASSVLFFNFQKRTTYKLLNF